MNLEGEILAALQPGDGVTAREIAKRLGQETTSVNSILYSLLNRGKVHKGKSHRWFHFASAEPQSEAGLALEKNMDAMPFLSSVYNPTPEQEPVISASPNSHLYVEAGPGTGKSETLVARLAGLLGDGGLNASQILVLSFSVAAVKELKSRIEHAHKNGKPNLSYIDIRTFDSFASRFLRLIIPAAELRGLNYDQRIQRATLELNSNKPTLCIIGEFKHVLLDEMQDLVGVRADFAFELLRVVQPCGFTLFGDSAQGIYDFQIQFGPSKTTASRLVQKIRESFPALNDSHRFTKNFRVGGNAHLENIAVHGRSLLLESTEKARTFLEKEFGSLSDQGSTGAPAIDCELLHSSTCVVCRTNGQVLRLAGELHRKNIPFEIARDKNEFLPPAWLGRLFLGWPEPSVRRAVFMERAKAILNLSEPDALVLWKNLVSSFGPSNVQSFDVSTLRASISDGIVILDLPLFTHHENVIKLSTVHRSKGREFSNVIVVMNTDGESTHAKKGEDGNASESEPRVLFVALTRAKKTLHRMEAKAKGVWMPDERWIRSFTGNNGFNKLSGFQVGLAQDVDNNSFALGEADDVFENQRLLVERCRPGSDVELVFSERDHEGCPMFKILVGKLPVGFMSSNFGWAIWHTLHNLNPKHKPNQFPKRITGIWVKEITSAVGDLGDQQVDRAFLTSGLWLTLALEGLGHCEWYD